MCTYAYIVWIFNICMGLLCKKGVLISSETNERKHLIVK